MKTSRYTNPTKKAISFEVGTMPDEKPEKVSCGAGEEIEGPSAYAKLYARHGLVLVEEKAKPEAKKVSPPNDENPKPEPKAKEKPKGKKE